MRVDLERHQELDLAAISQFEKHCWQDVISPADMALYACYARETFVGPNPAFLAVDLYNAVYRGGPRSPNELEPIFPNSCGVYAHTAVEPTKLLFAAARASGIPIFYCTKETWPNSRPRDAVSTRRRAASTPASSDDFEIYPDFTPEPTDIVVRKQRASAFHGTPLRSHLTLLGARSLIVCGESTSGCVRATCVDAYSDGFHVSLVEECTFDRAELIHKVNLFDLHHKYVDVMHVSEVVAHLAAIGGERGGAHQV